MTPQEVIDQAREMYNAVGDNYFSDEMLFNLVYLAEKQLAMLSNCIEKTYTTPSVASQREYEYPTKAISIKRLEYAGQKLDPIDFQLEDTMTLNGGATDISSDPKFYSVWKDTLYLFPTPATSDDTITIYAFDRPDRVTTTSVLDVPVRYHMDLVIFLVAHMNMKDQNFAAYREFMSEWKEAVQRAIRYQKKRLRGDAFAGVKNEDDLDVTILGAI